MHTIVFLLSGLFLTGCFFSDEQRSTIQEIKGEVFGSYYFIKYTGKLENASFQRELGEFFKEFNDEFSTYQKTSVISQFNDSPPLQRLKVSPRFIQMLEFSKKLHVQTGGAFDPTLGPVIKLWGFGGGEEKKIPTDFELKKAMSQVGIQYMAWDVKNNEVWKTRDGLQLDVNAFAPGWAADLVGKMLEKRSITNYMVDISGEIILKGEKSPGRPWIIGIERPSKEYAQGVQLALKLKDMAIATSGDYRQFFQKNGQRRSHIIDPRTGKPVTHKISSSTVITATAMEADAWSTAMMVLGKEGISLAEKLGIKVYLLEAKNPQEFNPIASPGMKLLMEQK